MPDPHQDPDAPNPLAAAMAHEIFDEAPAPSPGAPVPPGAGRAPRDPGSGGAGFLAWLVLIVAVGVTVWSQWLGPPPPPVAQTEMSPPGGLLRISGRYAVGAVDLVDGVASATQRDTTARDLIQTSEGFASTPEDRLRLAIVRGDLLGPDAAAAALDELEIELTTMDEPPAYADELFDDIDAVRALLGDPPAAPADSDAFRERHGWFADLALAQGLDDDAPARAPVLAKARRTAGTAIVALIGFGALIMLGFALAVVAVVLLAMGKIKAAYRAHAPGGSVYLEVFALFLIGFLGVSYASAWLAQQTGTDYSRALIWLLLLTPLWAVVRGARFADFRLAMGWHAGKGLFREVGAGLIGYVACLPIFLAGISLTLLAIFLVGLLGAGGEEGGAAPTHPILDQVDPGDLLSVLGVYAVAALWAPLVEESLFRGALYHHLRGRLHPILAGLGVAFIFAVIHPQGLVAIPALMSLAVTFALLREWRGSLIAPVVAHAIHNGALMTGLIIALS